MLITVVALAVVALSIGVSGEESSALYVEDLREHTVVVGNNATTFQELLGRMSSVDRVELDRVVEEIDGDLAEIDASLDADPPPPELAGPVTVFQLALDAWRQGATSFREAVFFAADDPAPTGVEERLVTALIELRTGDRLYGRFRQAMAAEGVPRPVSELPSVGFLPQAYPLNPAARTLALAAQAPGSPLELRAALTIQQVTTVPEWVVDTENALVVEATESLTVRAVVANQGNTDSEAGSLALRMEGIDGTAQEATAPVEPLPAGGETTVSFDPLPVVPGLTYQLTVQLPLAPGEVETEDNTRSLRFRVNEPTPETTTTTGSG